MDPYFFAGFLILENDGTKRKIVNLSKFLKCYFLNFFSIKIFALNFEGIGKLICFKPTLSIKRQSNHQYIF